MPEDIEFEFDLHDTPEDIERKFLMLGDDEFYHFEAWLANANEAMQRIYEKELTETDH